MAGSIYRVNKEVGKSIEFKGLKAQYIWVLAGGVVGLLMLFAILFIAGVNQYVCIIIVLALGAVVVSTVFRLSKRFGEHGLMKWQASKSIPKHLRAYSRRPFNKRILSKRLDNSI